MNRNILSTHGEVWLRREMPKHLRDVTKEFILGRPTKDYLFIVVCTMRDGSRVVSEALALDRMPEYRLYTGINRLPIIFNYHTHTVTGPLAPRFGLWSVETLPFKYRGMMYPPKSAWTTIRPGGNYYDAKYFLARSIEDNKRKHARDQRTFRLNLVGTMTGQHRDKSYHFMEGHIEINSSGNLFM